SLFVVLLLPSSLSTLFPYTTLFRSQRSRHHGLRRHASGSNVFAGMLLSGTSSDAPEPRDRNSRIVSCSSDSTRIGRIRGMRGARSEEHTSELQSRVELVCRLLLETK